MGKDGRAGLGGVIREFGDVGRDSGNDPPLSFGCKGLSKNNMAEIALRFGLDLAVAISAKPQA